MSFRMVAIYLALWFAAMIAPRADARVFVNSAVCMDASHNLYSASGPINGLIRVSMRNATDTTAWVRDFSPPTGWTFINAQNIGVDSNGSIYVAGLVSKTGSEAFYLLAVNQNGTLTAGPAVYNPAAAGEHIGLTTMIVATDKPTIGAATTVIDLVGNIAYGSGEGIYMTGFVTQFKQNLSVVKRINFPKGYTTDDAVLGSDVYVAALWNGQNYANGQPTRMLIYGLTIHANNIAWQYVKTLPSSLYGYDGYGCLTVDSSGLITYLAPVAYTTTYGSDVYGIQLSKVGRLNWAKTLGLTNYGYLTNWSIADSTGNIIVTATADEYYSVAKISPTGTLLWNSVGGPSFNLIQIVQDKSGDYLAVNPYSTSTGNVSQVERFSGSTGALTATYQFNVNGSDTGWAILPTASPGIFYVFGVGQWTDGHSYPLWYEAAGNTVIWYDYQTTDK